MDSFKLGRIKNIPQAESRSRTLLFCNLCVLNDEQEIKITQHVKITQILKGVFCITLTMVFLLHDTSVSQFVMISSFNLFPTAPK